MEEEVDFLESNFKDLTSIPRPNVSQLTTLIRLKLFPRVILLNLLAGLDLPPTHLSDLFYDLLTDLADCSTSEYLAFISSPLLLSLLQTRLASPASEDHQLVRHLDSQVFKRLRGRFPDLSHHLFTQVKGCYVERVTR